MVLGLKLKNNLVMPLNGKNMSMILLCLMTLITYILEPPQYEGILDVTSNWLNRSNVGTFYKYSVLLPKAGSQIAKTILSPLTHVRNVISAGAFVSANGAFFPNYGDIQMLLPKMFGGEGAIGQAYKLSGKEY